jgi:hypothetical protein
MQEATIRIDKDASISNICFQTVIKYTQSLNKINMYLKSIVFNRVVKDKLLGGY